MDREADQAAAEGLKPWKTPMLRKMDLTADELAQLQASEDPIALLVEMKPDLAAGNLVPGEPDDVLNRP